MKNFQHSKKVLSIFLTLALIISFTPSFSASAKESKEDVIVSTESKEWTDEEIISLGYVPGEVIVKFKKGKVDLKSSKASRKVEDFTKKTSRRIKETKRLSQNNAVVFKSTDQTSTDVLVRELKKNTEVEYVIPNYVFEFQSVINDPEYTGNNQWGLEKIQIEGAMDEMNGPIDDVVVAILDTGLSFSHPDFDDSVNGNLWDGSGCVDQSNNTIVGGCPNHGWDFVGGDDNPQDDNGHGTHVAGIIGATKDFSGVAGTSSNVKMMIVKIGNSYGTFANALNGINFAKNNGADIINASYGGGPFSIDMESAINSFTQTGLFVASAGNSAELIDDMNAYYPASYGENEVIAVAATESDDDIWYSILSGEGSNWDAENVDVAAPGYNIKSTYMTREENLTEGFFLGGLGGFTKDSTTPNYWDAALWASVDGELYSDNQNYPDDDSSNIHYTPDVTDAGMLSPTIDLSGAKDDTAVVHFDVWCDTEPQGVKASVPDYMDVYAVSGGSEEKLNDAPIHEHWIASQFEQVRNNLIGRIAESDDGNSGLAFVIPNNLLSSSTQIKFTWTTDGNDVGGPYRGCAVDNVKVLTYDEDTYEEISGTSMAAPFVTGVAAMIWGKYPSLTASQVKQIIMDSGDYVADLDPVTGTHSIVSGNRLNAYRALVLAGQVAAGQTDVFLYPTIKSTPAGGYWSNAGTWEGGVVPTVTDVVEIDGTVTLNATTTVAGLIVNSGETLRSSGSTYNLTLSGANADMVINGTLMNYSGGRISLTMGGNLEVNGTMNINVADVAGNLYNSGAILIRYM